MPSAVLIANPSASQFTGGVFRHVTNILGRTFDLATEWPISPSDTAATTKKAVEDGIDVVFAMGGDGVAHHVANGLAESDTALGLIPVGTTNVLARILGIPSKPERAAEMAVELDPIPTRMVRIAAHTPLGPMVRYATFSVGVGFDADVVEVAEARPFAKSRFGSFHYASTAISRLISSWRSEHPNLRLTCDGDRFDAVVALTQVHHPYTYFGRIPLHLTPDPPHAVATLAADDLGITKAAEIFSRAALGFNHRDATGTKLWTDFRRLTIDAEPRAPFQADGEMLGYADRLTLSPSEGAMKVLRPQSG